MPLSALWQRWRTRLPTLVHLPALLAGCAAPPPKPTVVQASLQAAGGLNPDRRERASPITLRIYELKTGAAFGRADFFSLWDGEGATLGADLVARDELQLRPGESRTLQRTLQPDTRELGVVAAFRDLERAQWRATHTVVPNQTQAVTIQLEARSVRILPAAAR